MAIGGVKLARLRQPRQTHSVLCRFGFALASDFKQSYAEGSTMTRFTEAVYSKGVLKPADDLGLREDQRARLIVETAEDAPEDRAAALARLKAGIAKMQFFSQGPLPSRGKLHHHR
jgi:predicted DNA-binding antitoxin AbrB/MazE fold protein